MNIILGSSSPSRKAVLESMGFVFTTISPDIDERAIRLFEPYVHVDGEWEALMGLPKEKTLEMIKFVHLL